MMIINLLVCGSTCGSSFRAIPGALLLTLQLSLILAVPSMQGQTFTVLHQFAGKGDGEYPGSVIRDSKGNLFGVTDTGGSFDVGAVFEIDVNGKETILHSFWGGDGFWPFAPLLRDSAGNLYGTTEYGGTPKRGKCWYGCGTVFKLDSAGKETVLHAFTGGKDGGSPAGGLVRDREGNLYGTTSTGGEVIACHDGCGVVFKLDTSGKETVLHEFGRVSSDGWDPSGGLVQDKAGNLYGTTWSGGTGNCDLGCGTVFRVNNAGRETVLYSFTGKGADSGPSGPLVRDPAGNLYGVTVGPMYCTTACGAVFKVTKSGKESVLYTFKGGSDGSLPSGGLTRDSSGSLYGTTWYGGSDECDTGGCGTIFKVDTNGNETVLYSFTGGQYQYSPQANGSLILGEDGSLYGSTSQGGDLSCGYQSNTGCGMVFKLTGYAYETIANKSIIAGKTKGPDVVTVQPASLGHLARGASAIPAWRAKETK
jgi:uncharacterized repeat protein (TIGR03803 family)